MPWLGHHLQFALVRITDKMTTRGGRVSRGAGRGSSRGGAVGSINTSSSSQISNNCGLCSTVVGNDCIGCDQCPAWFHPTTQCTGLNKAELNCVKSGGGRGVRFVCTTCRCQTSQSNSAELSVSAISASMSQLHEIVKGLAETVANLTQQMTLLISNPPQQQQNSGTFTRESLYTEMREFEERKKRSDSLIIRGVQTGDVSDFSNSFGDICRVLINKTPIINDVFCIDSGRGIFRLKVLDREDRIAILSNAKNLKNIDQLRNVYISRDLTYSQRQELFKKRSEARSQAQSNSQLTGAEQSSSLNSNSSSDRPATRLSVLNAFNPVDSQPPVTRAAAAAVAPNFQ